MKDLLVKEQTLKTNDTVAQKTATLRLERIMPRIKHETATFDLTFERRLAANG
jgi:hypothetical protein